MSCSSHQSTLLKTAIPFMVTLLMIPGASSAQGLKGMGKALSRTFDSVGAQIGQASKPLQQLAQATSATAVQLAAVTPSASVNGFTYVEASTAQIPVEVRKGTLIRLKAPASSVFISDPEVADIQIKSPRLIYVFGKRPGDTSLFALSKDEEVLFNGIISVRFNLTKLHQTYRELLPNSAITVKSIDGSLALTGRVDSSRDAEEARRIARLFAGEKYSILNYLKITGPTQVNLRVRIAEISRDIVKELGFNWDATFNDGRSLLGIASGSPVLVGNSLLVRNDTTSSFFGALTRGNFDVNTVIDALEEEGMVSVLAEPNLTALSGETASFLAGGEFPIPVPQDNDAITITFKRFGVGLSFTPTILSDRRINLRVSPEVSQLSSSGAVSIQGFAVPALTTRRAETTVELASGQSFAIAGLIQSNMIRTLRKLPGLGDIPILGALFRSDRFQRQETELVIIVTPYIVQPVSGKRMLVPTDGFEAPNDVQRLLKGYSYRPHPLEGPAQTEGGNNRRLVGSAGFMLN